MLAEEQPAGCVRVYPTLTTYLLNIHTSSSLARADSPSKNKVKSELWAGEDRQRVRGKKEGRKEGGNRGEKEVNKEKLGLELHRLATSML